MSRDIFLILIGAGIALISGLATTILQHFLSIRTERKKQEWAREEMEAEERKKGLLVGVPGVTNVTRYMRTAENAGSVIAFGALTPDANDKTGTAKVKGVEDAFNALLTPDANGKTGTVKVKGDEEKKVDLDSL